MGIGEPLSLSLPCCFIHSAAFSLHDRIHSVLVLSLPSASAQASSLVLSCPGLGEMKRSPYSAGLGGSLPGLWKVDPQASRDTARASFSWTVGAFL